MSETVTISTLSGNETFAAYVARPAKTPKAAILVIQEIFGVNAGIRRKCDKLAEEGYLAVAPDLFWRLEPDVELDPDVEPEFQRALDLMGKFNQDQGIRDIEATIHHIRREEGVPKVGCVGYCLGGRLAYMTAARTDVDASVGYYGVGIDGLLDEKHAIAHPLMLHIPDRRRVRRQGYTKGHACRAGRPSEGHAPRLRGARSRLRHRIRQAALGRGRATGR